MNHDIPREAYLAYAKNFTDKECGLIDEFSLWLPNEIIDCHAHCNLSEHVRSIDERAYHHMLSTFPSFSLDESKEWQTLLHPGKTVRTLRFPKTFRGVDHRAANLYLLHKSPEQDRVALYGLPDDPDYTISMLQHPRASALKMYYSYLEPPAIEIYQYFPKVILAAAEMLDIPIILHPPRRITSCLDQILQLIDDFPRLRICIAHLGLTKSVIPGLEDAFAAMANNHNVSFDTALVPSPKSSVWHYRSSAPTESCSAPTNHSTSSALRHISTRNVGSDWLRNILTTGSTLLKTRSSNRLRQEQPTRTGNLSAQSELLSLLFL